MEDGVLYRVVNIDGERQKQLVLPEACIGKVLSALHDDMGHQGRDKTVSLVRDRFIWFGMNRDVDKWISNCDRCIRRKAVTDKAPLTSVETTQPLELVCMDYLTLDRSKGGYENLLVIVDHFTRYALAIPTRNQTARTTADAFFNNFVVHYGLPDRIHSDQGANFCSKIIKELCDITGMTKSRTTPYHPMGNGIPERFNRTIMNMLGTLENTQKKDWKSHVASLVHAYNCTRQTTTGFAPYFLMFGRHPKLPIDVAFGLGEDGDRVPKTKYAEEMQHRLKTVYDIASKNINNAQIKQKSGFDKKIKGAVLKPGDRVLVKTLAFDGRHKLADKWEDDPYRIVSQPNSGIPVYVVKKENGEGRKRTLHRNHLLPIGDLPNDEKKQKKRPAPRQRKQKEKPVDIRTTKSEVIGEENTATEESDEESEQEFGYYYIPGQSTQFNTNSDDQAVEGQEDGTLGFTGDGHAEPRREEIQVTDFGEDAFPAVDRETAESTPVGDEEFVQTTAQEIEEDTSIPDESALTEPSQIEADESPTHAPRTPATQRRRRVLPTPPRDSPLSQRPQRNRKLPGYLSDYVLSKQAVSQQQQPEWLMKITWLESEVRKGRFKGLENELERTILYIMKTT